MMVQLTNSHIVEPVFKSEDVVQLTANHLFMMEPMEASLAPCVSGIPLWRSQSMIDSRVSFYFRETPPFC